MLKSIFSFLEAIGKARAASHLANHGYYDLAKKLVTGCDDRKRERIAEAQEVHP